MKYFVLLAFMFGTINLASVALADSTSPVACALLNEKEAVALVNGGPLGEVFKNEQKPTMENGRDHNSVCGFFPKGYKIATADLPPEHGILLTIHAMQTAAAAKNFYEQSLTSEQEMISMPGPLAGGKITMLSGTGKAAYLVENKIEPGSSSSGVATIVFLKGNVMGQVQVWKKGGQSGEIAKKAVKNLVAKLP